MLAALALAISLPIDRQYILAETVRPMAEISSCVALDWENQGVATVTDTDYGQRVDYRYSNIGGAVKDPTVTLEIHEGQKRTLLLYGFGTWRGAIKGVWSHTSKKCAPETKAAPVVKP